MYIVFIVSWVSYPCIFIVTAEGFGSFSTTAASLAYGLANLFSVNILSALCWHTLSALQGSKDVDWTAMTPGMASQSPADFLKDPALTKDEVSACGK